jgi:two-component system nitrate/nitrite response regulator NarL
MCGRIRLIIVADVRLYRDGLAATLGAYGSLMVAGSAGSPDQAASMIRNLSPDVLIIDMAMVGAFELIRDVRIDTPDVRVIAFAIDDKMSTIIDCAESGASGYVTAEASIDELVSAIERAAAGELVCAPRVTAELFRRMGEQSPVGNPSQRGSCLLTCREQQVLGSVREGLSNKEIATNLFIAEATVKNHVHHILEKLQVGSRAQAVVCTAGSLGRRRHFSGQRVPSRQDI